MKARTTHFLMLLLLALPAFGAGTATRITKVKSFKNSSLDALQTLAADHNTWIHDEVWGRFGSSFDWNAKRYQGYTSKDLEKLAKKALYGRRGISQKDYEATMLQDFTRVKNDSEGKDAVYEQLIAHTKLRGTPKETHEAAATIKKAVGELSSDLVFFTATEDYNEDVGKLYVTAIIDTKNQEVFTLSVGNLDIPQEPLE